MGKIGAPNIFSSMCCVLERHAQIKKTKRYDVSHMRRLTTAEQNHFFFTFPLMFPISFTFTFALALLLTLKRICALCINACACDIIRCETEEAWKRWREWLDRNSVCGASNVHRRLEETSEIHAAGADTSGEQRLLHSAWSCMCAHLRLRDGSRNFSRWYRL